MKRRLVALFPLFLVGVLFGLAIDVTPLADITNLNPMQSLVFYDVNADGLDEWFVISEAYGTGTDTVKIVGFDTAGSQVFYAALPFPRTTGDADHDEPKFTIYRSGEDTRLLLVQGNRYWDSQTMVIDMRFYSFPAMAYLGDYVHTVAISQATSPYNRHSFATIRRPYIVSYNAAPHLYLTMLHRLTASDEYSSAAATSSYILRFSLDGITPAYADSLDQGGCCIYCPLNTTGCLLSVDTSTDLYTDQGGLTNIVTYSLVKLATSSAHTDSVLYYVEGEREDYDLTHFPAGVCVVTQCDTVCTGLSPSLGLLTQISDGGVGSPDRSLDYLSVRPDEITLWEQPDIDVAYGFSAASYVSIPEENSYIIALCYRYGLNDTQFAMFDRTDGRLLDTATMDCRVPLELFECDGQYYLVSQSVSGDVLSLYRLDSITVGVQEGDVAVVKPQLRAYPNPFNPETSVCFRMSAPSLAQLDVYDIRGRRVATLLDEPMQAGEHTVHWSATGLPSGVYLLRLEAGGRTETTKALLLK